MPYSRSVRFRWPPAPCVEEEPASLARELHGLSKLGETPGVEGARTRGTVDQYPVIVTLDSPPPVSTSPPSVSNVPGLDNVSSDDSTGRRTPPAVSEPLARTASGSQTTSRSTSSSRGPPSSASSKSRNHPPTQVHQQQPSRELKDPGQSRLSSYSRDGKPMRGEGPVYITPSSSRGPSAGRTASHGPVHETSHLSVPKVPLGRSNSARYAPSKMRPAPGPGRPVHSSGYVSDSATTRSRSSSQYTPGRASTAPEKPPLEKPAGAPTLAERIEEKLRLRQALRDSGSHSDTEARTTAPKAKSIKTTVDGWTTDSAPVPSSHELHRTPSYRSHERPSAGRPRATSMASAAPTQPPPSRSTSKNRTSVRSNSSDEAQASSSKSRRQRGSVKFEDDLPQKPSQSQAASSGNSGTIQRPSKGAGLCDAPCPRSIPTAGYTDWYTLKGLTHLDICPSCMGQIAHSRFRDFFIPSLPKPSTQKTRCAFANPWTRLAWAQMIKKKHDSLEILYQMTRPPPGARPCPGRIVTDQTWHRAVDPDTGLYLPRFQICGACARNVRILMPSHRDTFQASAEPKERVCDFVTNSPRFIHFIDLLDRAAIRAAADPARRPDLREFLAYARRKVVLRDCRRDRPTMSTWHYIPALPEFSVCEDCYDEVVWPLAKAQHPIARMFSPSMRLLPGDGPNRCREASCQLYSARVRARFRDAVTKGDFPMLKSMALRRFEAERRFKDRREELLVAEGRGYDCEVEMRKAIEEWRRFE
ncbi:uncharacterized protein N7459_003045 [Penicillium hispanicum]|uniref:uncharacterized protein n=1 Tax=Penicillium hispanicum TaxID=1080232 RepID=UPI002541B052|nr:uncharacterized protein N7459_003045 [Penicillium hispanicum]KAJ5587280.1 hypothetical protein N7459_003045 [Penicillium hispanicum]